MATAEDPTHSSEANVQDPLPEALTLIEAARSVGVPLRLVGGLAVRVLCPDFPPRARRGQDLDLASLSRTRSRLTQLLQDRGFEADKRFNALYGHKQLYFRSPRLTIDVLVDRIEMCHDLPFADRLERLPLTLDLADLLLSKLQIVELNEKDARDVVYLLAAYPVRDGEDPSAISLARLREMLAGDWGWWRTVTLNLDRIRRFALDPAIALVPAGAPFDPIAQLAAIAEMAEATPKTLRWTLRARVGERKRWYRVPQEDSHD